MSVAVSSNVIKTPGSPNSVAPRIRNSVANSDLPQPAAPQTSVGRPAGTPPPVISSNPGIPVGAFSRRGLEMIVDFFAIFISTQKDFPQIFRAAKTNAVQLLGKRKSLSLKKCNVSPSVGVF